MLNIIGIESTNYWGNKKITEAINSPLTQALREQITEAINSPLTRALREQITVVVSGQID